MSTIRKERRAKQFSGGKPELVATPNSTPGKFDQPSEIKPFADVIQFMPKMADIPDEFTQYNPNNPFIKLQSDWFFNGLKQWPLMPKPGINHKVAIAHLSAIQRSFEPQHEHKEAAVAYLMSLWYEAPKKT